MLDKQTNKQNLANKNLTKKQTNFMYGECELILLLWEQHRKGINRRF